LQSVAVGDAGVYAAEEVSGVKVCDEDEAAPWEWYRSELASLSTFASFLPLIEMYFGWPLTTGLEPSPPVDNHNS
jgi:hypothetical protein